MIKAVLIDLSGTVHVGDRLIPGAIEACMKLRAKGFKILFLTNTSKISSSSLVQQLRRIGFDELCIPEDSIMTSVIAARNYITRNRLRPLPLVEDNMLEDLKGVNFSDPNCVLVGLAPTAFAYNRLNEAFRLLMRLGLEGNVDQRVGCKPIIAIHRAKYFRDNDGELSLGPGGFVSCLEEAAGVQAEVIGKPSKSFFDAALDKLGVDATHAVMIGDDVIQDVQGALSAGIGKGILVRTGKYRQNDELNADTRPTFVADSIVEAVEYIISFNASDF